MDFEKKTIFWAFVKKRKNFAKIKNQIFDFQTRFLAIIIDHLACFKLEIKTKIAKIQFLIVDPKS
jgi:hypothetical protein